MFIMLNKYLEIFVKINLVCVFVHFSVITHTFFKKVRFSIQADSFHKIEWIGRIPDLFLTHLFQESIGHVFNILCHLFRIHTDETTRKGVYDERFLNFYSLFHNLLNRVFVRFKFKHIEQFDRKLLVESLISAYKFVTETETREKTRFLSQKMAQKLPEKNIPSTHAKARRRSLNGLDASNHFIAHLAFFSIHGTRCIASNNSFFSEGERMYLSISLLYVSPCTISLCA